MVDYISRYGLDFNPFVKNSKDIIIETYEYKESIYRLDYLLDNKGFGVITGGAGCGKTTIVRSWVSKLNPSLYKVVYTSLSTLSVNEFYKHLASELALEQMHKKSDNFKNIQAEINRFSIEKRITPVILIDEANYISSGILNDFKMLFNFEMDSKDRAVILLVGLPDLNNKLKLSSNEPLRQRISMNYNLVGLSKTEASEYIKGKLGGARSTSDVFNANAVNAIINAGNGIPRLINKICNASLIIANSRNANIIDEEIVMSAVNDIELG